MTEQIDYNRRTRVTKNFTEPSRVKPEFNDASNINTIMEKWQKTSVVPFQDPRTPAYGDFTDAVDFQTAKNNVLAAEHAFAQMTAETRDRMENDPAKLLEFLADPANAREAYELGLTDTKPEPEPEPEPPLTPPVTVPT